MYRHRIGNRLDKPRLLARDQDAKAAISSSQLRHSQSDPAITLFLSENPAKALNQLRRQLLLPQIRARLDNH